MIYATNMLQTCINNFLCSPRRYDVKKISNSYLQMKIIKKCIKLLNNITLQIRYS